MKNSRNRLTPFLVIVLIVLIWVLIGLVIYKLMAKDIIHLDPNTKKLKLDDDLVQELYSYVTDDDIILYSSKDYTIDDIPLSYLISKGSKFMTIEDVYFESNKVTISYDSMDSAIKMAFGPDIKYEITSLDEVLTYLELNDHRLALKLDYDADSENYVGTYREVSDPSEVKVAHKLLGATKNDTVNLEIGYFFYKGEDSYQICKDASCKSVKETITSLDDAKYDNTLIVSLKKASDGVYYYYKNS